MADGGIRDSSLVKRVVIAIIFVPLLLWIFAVRGIALYIFTLAVTLVGQGELFGMFDKQVPVPQRIISLLAGFVIISDAYFLGSMLFPGVIIGVLMTAFICEITNSSHYRLNTVAFTLFSSIYPAALIMFLLKIEQLDSGPFTLHFPTLFMFFIVTIWCFDSMSYFTGKFFGKHRFFPKISPKKTVEGFLGGVFGALLTGFAGGMLIDQNLLAHFLAISLFVALASQAGDLSESIIKRSMSIKDSSQIIPGHGGILDRFDSLIFASPVLYAYVFIINWLHRTVL